MKIFFALTICTFVVAGCASKPPAAPRAPQAIDDYTSSKETPMVRQILAFLTPLKGMYQLDGTPGCDQVDFQVYEDASQKMVHVTFGIRRTFQGGVDLFPLADTSGGSCEFMGEHQLHCSSQRILGLTGPYHRTNASLKYKITTDEAGQLSALELQQTNVPVLNINCQREN